MKCWMWSMLLVVQCAFAAGPRWVAGSQWTNNGRPMGWYRADVQFFVDAGPLSASVDHAAAVALVDAAASVWNVANVPLTLTNGGALAEDVTSANVYLGTNGPVWPADVQSSGYASKQIAVVLDADGSITDMLLGSGASEPGNCRQSAVTETVDLFVQPGRIAHALIVVNGRCSGPAPEQQMQLQYQLMRVFGRVLGLSWSQTNDNVFTGLPVPTYAQQMHWPIMHPIDIVCGLYTYQCLPQPFTLRDDDVAALQLVYGNWNVNAVNAIGLSGTLTFSDGLGMNGLNMTVQRGTGWDHSFTEAFQDVSAVTGFLAKGDLGNPIRGASSDTAGVQGSTSSSAAGYFLFYGVPALTQYSITNLLLKSEAINPLYVGAYAVGPYRQSTVLPSGSAFTGQYTGFPVGLRYGVGTVAMTGSAGVCGGADGVESAPTELFADGVWESRLCGVGHSAWSSIAVKAGRTGTLELTALDESGVAATRKARPVAGMWHGADAMGVLPTMAAVTAAQNTSHAGMTQLRVAFGQTERVRFAVSDERGDGRPDYTYRGRWLYADAVMPSQLSAAGGAIRIVGTGFAQGCTVTVGGVLAQVTSVLPTEIDAVAPAVSALGGTASVDVTVTDPRTNGTTSIVNALHYAGGPDDVVSWELAPRGTTGVGVAAPFRLQVVNDTGRPSANAMVSVSVTGGSGVVGACGLANCTLLTDAAGVVQSTATAQATGVVTVQALVKSGSAVSASFTAVTVSRGMVFVRPTEYVAAGAGAVFAPAVLLTSGDAAAAGQTVAWSTASTRVALATAMGSTAADGRAAVIATGALRDGEAVMTQACGWLDVCVTQAVVGVAAAALRVGVSSGDGQSVAAGGTLARVTLRVTDTAGHPVAGAAVSIYQVVTGWQPPCVGAGRCAVAPVYGKSTSQTMSDDDGLVTAAPLQYANTAAVTKMTATVGTQGSITVSLQKTP